MGSFRGHQRAFLLAAHGQFLLAIDNQGHAAGAIHMPYREIALRAPAELDPETPVVVYCWSPGCNAGAKGAVEFAKLGFRVREMIGGFEYWAREGLPVDGAEGPLRRRFDPLVMYVRGTD